MLPQMTLIKTEVVRRSESSDAGSGKGEQRRLIHNNRGPGTTWRGVRRIPGER